MPTVPAAWGMWRWKVLVQSLYWHRHDAEPVCGLLGGTSDGRLPAWPVSRRVRKLHRHALHKLYPMRRGELSGGRVHQQGRRVQNLYELWGDRPDDSAELHDLQRRRVHGGFMHQRYSLCHPRPSAEHVEVVLRLLPFADGILRGLSERILLGRSGMSGVPAGQDVQSARGGAVQRPVPSRDQIELRG